MIDIFVSYRRSDSSDVTGRIYDQLKTRFSGEHLFKDVDSIPLGRDFRGVIAEAVGQCNVLIAVIGDDWLTVKDESGQRRLDNPDDFVRIEISTALQRGIPVIPVIVERALMPTADQLPEALRDLAYRNGIAVRPDPDFHADMDRLCQNLASYLGNEHTAARKKSMKWMVGAVALLLCIAAAAILYKAIYPQSSDPNKVPDVVHPDRSGSDTLSESPVPIRYWVDKLPVIEGEDDADKLFHNALGSWQAVIGTSIRQTDKKSDANVIVTTGPDPGTFAFVREPHSNQTVRINFDPQTSWTAHTFEAASCRMLGHVLGLTYTDKPGQVMTDPQKLPLGLESLPRTPQADDKARARAIWGE